METMRVKKNVFVVGAEESNVANPFITSLVETISPDQTSFLAAFGRFCCF